MPSNSILPDIPIAMDDSSTDNNDTARSASTSRINSEYRSRPPIVDVLRSSISRSVPRNILFRATVRRRKKGALYTFSHESMGVILIAERHKKVSSFEYMFSALNDLDVHPKNVAETSKRLVGVMNSNLTRTFFIAQQIALLDDSKDDFVTSGGAAQGGLDNAAVMDAMTSSTEVATMGDPSSKHLQRRGSTGLPMQRGRSNSLIQGIRGSFRRRSLPSGSTREICAIDFQLNAFKKGEENAPKSVRFLRPIPDPHSGSVTFHPETREDSLEARMKNENFMDLLLTTNEKPRRDPRTGRFTIPSRVKDGQRSTRNFVMFAQAQQGQGAADPHADDRPFLSEIVKVSKKDYAVVFVHPLSLLQSFALAVADLETTLF
eukprot:Rmarinus@m.20931